MPHQPQLHRPRPAPRRKSARRRRYAAHPAPPLPDPYFLVERRRQPRQHALLAHLQMVESLATMFCLKLCSLHHNLNLSSGRGLERVGAAARLDEATAARHTTSLPSAAHQLGRKRRDWKRGGLAASHEHKPLPIGLKTLGASLRYATYQRHPIYTAGGFTRA